MMIRLFTVKNIPVEISIYSLVFMGILVLPVAGFSMMGGGWILLIGLFLGFAGSILIHELAHALVGTAMGAVVSGIQLNMLGGVTFFAKKPPSYFKDIIIALAGPVSNLVLWKGFEALGQLLIGSASFNTNLLTSGNGGQITMQLGFTFWMLAQYNLILGVFNAMPAYPLDGGHTVYALVNLISRDDKFAAGLVLCTSGLVVFDLLFNRFSPLGGLSGAFLIGGGGLFTTYIAVWILISAFSLYNNATRVVSGFKPTTRERAEKRQAEDAKKAKAKKGYADFLKGKELMLAKSYQESIAYLSQAIAADPDELEYLDYRAYTFVEMKQYEQALGDYNSLVSKAPPYRLPDYLAQRAEVFIKLGNLEYARRDIVYSLSVNSAHYHTIKVKSDLEKMTGQPVA